MLLYRIIFMIHAFIEKTKLRSKYCTEIVVFSKKCGLCNVDLM